ncbi:hypothetical protein ACN28I_19165 [Archangium gephyra]|uniref:hypothetical protein n=1 Tax=Archangium gephyra TaxID=48 RepID=UPI003B777983
MFAKMPPTKPAVRVANMTTAGTVIVVALRVATRVDTYSTPAMPGMGEYGANSVLTRYSEASRSMKHVEATSTR